MTMWERFNQHPGGRYCLERMPGLENAELWRRPVVDCLTLEPWIAPFEHDPLWLLDNAVTKNAQQYCWEGVPESKILYRDENGIWGVKTALPLNEYDRAPSEDYGDTKDFRRNWCEAVLSYDCARSAAKSKLLSLTPWCWTDQPGIFQLLAEFAKTNLKAKIKMIGPKGINQPQMVRGWDAWDTWRRKQSTNMDDLVQRLVNEERYPPDLTASGL